jgi:4-carboxymuconolactone decarboxylase
MKPKRYVFLFALLLPIVAFLGCHWAQRRAEKPFRLSQPRLAPLAESQWSEEQNQLLAPWKEEDGHVINALATLIRNPTLCERWLPMLDYILSGESLPAREREILILRIGWLCQAKYEFGQHTLGGKSAGLTPEEILRITRGPDEPGWSSFDAALLRTADELHHSAIISDATWKALSERYNEKQLLDVIATVGQYNAVCWVLNSLGVQLDEGVPGFPEDSKR